MDTKCSPSGAVEIDTDRFPIVVHRLHRPMEDADLEWTMRRYERLFEEGRRYALIVWPESGVDSTSGPRQRIKLAEWEQAVAPLSARYNVCTAVVLESKLQRRLFAAYRWLSKAATPQMGFSTVAEAERWVTEMLEADGVMGSTPPTARGPG